MLYFSTRLCTIECLERIPKPYIGVCKIIMVIYLQHAGADALGQQSLGGREKGKIIDTHRTYTSITDGTGMVTIHTLPMFKLSRIVW